MRNMFGFLVLLGAIAGITSAQTPAAPTNLTVKSATNRVVQLSWIGDSAAFAYVVERRPVGGTYAPLITITGIGSAAPVTAANDTDFDPFTAYQYRVRATAGTNSSDNAAEVTVGPPPT